MDHGFVAASFTPFLKWLLGFLSGTAVAALKVSVSDESATMPRFSR
ncbi:hypothetical protein OAM00_03895 [Verrucomicrobia bacterium]|nr:hypothetical protein [Verrucomicrobiota bacterium]